MAEVATFDFHVTSKCSQACAYCWGPMDIPEVDTATARAIVSKIASVGARRIVFTGGDPLQRADIASLIRHAAQQGLEVALSTTGDMLNASLLDEVGGCIDLISLPLDGSSEQVSSRTKKPGHFTAVMAALDLLAAYPEIDVKVATPVTSYNIEDVPNIARLLDDRAGQLPGRLFYNVFQVFPRSMDPTVAWGEMVVDDADFAALRERVEATPHPYRINWLSHETLDKLYVMVFPDGSLTVPSGSEFRRYGPFLEVSDLDAMLTRTDFDAPKHQRHAQGWSRSAPSIRSVDPHEEAQA
jgi:MoaA/NifB/PqqE/SkfB family radical SAM enzyme